MADYQFEITWLGHAAFKIKSSSGKTIYLDPYKIKKGEEQADIVVSTHSHGDHFDAGSIKKIKKDDTVVIGPTSISSDLAKFNGKPLKFGESFNLEDVSIELIPAYNIKKPNHPKSSAWAGIIVKAGDKSIYHAGDTERIPEMKELAKKNITVALMPCGGTYTMDFDESTDSIIDVKPKIAVPMHNLYIFNV